MKFSFKKTFLISLILAFVIRGSIYSQNIGEKAYINVNKFFLPFNSAGVIAAVNIPPHGHGGLFDGDYILFSSGFFLSGIMDSVWANGVMPNILVHDYLPGTTNIGPEDPRSALYKLRNDDSDFGQSWQDWRDAVELGAYFYDGNGDGIYDPLDLNGNGVWDPDEDKPDIIGDETYWCSYTDAVPMEERRWNVEPFGIEIKQTIFAFETDQLPLSNVVFIRYKIINTSSVIANLEEVIFGHPYDTDLGDFNDDLGGTDIGRNASYTYNDSLDSVFGDNPPAFLADFLSGPVVYIPGVTFLDVNGNGTYEHGIDTPIDTAYAYRGPLGVEVFIGASTLKMMSGITYADGDPGQGEPRNPVETRNYQKGLKRNGAEVDPCTYPYGEVRGGIDCHTINPYFWFSGDPVTDVGWINTSITENHSMFSLRPFELNANQYKEIIIAYLVGRGTDALNSVDIAKALSDEIQDFYENNFGYPIVLNIDNDFVNPIDYSLSQNYPNPFNPTTIISYQIPQQGFVTLKIYDVLGKEVATLINQEKSAGNYEVVFNSVGLASGVYIYRMKVNDFITSKKMILIK